jgi:hypothetical protein
MCRYDADGRYPRFSALTLAKLYTNSLLMLFNNRATFSHAGASTQSSRGGRLTAQSNLVNLTSPTRPSRHSRGQSKPGFITVTTESVTDRTDPISMSDIQVSSAAA